MKTGIPNRKYRLNASISRQAALNLHMLIAVALFVEAEPLISALNARRIEKYSKNTGLYRCHGHDILITGIGAKMAERTLLRYMERTHPAFLLNIGTAGMLDPGLSLNAVFEIPGCYNEALTRHETLCLKEGGQTAECVTVSRPLVYMNKRRQLFERSGAGLVDMECFALAETARQNGIKMSALKVTTDAADEATEARFAATLQPAVKQLTEICLERFIKMS